MSERFAADLFPAFCETAVWAADVEGAGFGDGQAAQVRQDLADWHGRHRDLVAEAFDNAPRYRDGADGFGGVELFAHDLCLTAGGHGTGFWDQSDRDVPEGLRDRLTAAAHDLPERSLW
jgi:hypothetical protein